VAVAVCCCCSSSWAGTRQLDPPDRCRRTCPRLFPPLPCPCRSPAGKQRRWDMVASHPSVAVLLYHRQLQSVILVRQFRPAVYVSAAREAEAAGQAQPPLSGAGGGQGRAMRGALHSLCCCRAVVQLLSSCTALEFLLSWSPMPCTCCLVPPGMPTCLSPACATISPNLYVPMPCSGLHLRAVCRHHRQAGAGPAADHAGGGGMGCSAAVLCCSAAVLQCCAPCCSAVLRCSVVRCVCCTKACSRS
jgi:hypothetical protein